MGNGLRAPVRRWAGNQTDLLAVRFAHNLVREWQMATAPPERSTTPQRSALGVFEKLETFRRRLIQRAGRLTRPQGILTLTIRAAEVVQDRLLQILASLPRAA